VGRSVHRRRRRGRGSSTARRGIRRTRTQQQRYRQTGNVSEEDPLLRNILREGSYYRGGGSIDFGVLSFRRSALLVMLILLLLPALFLEFLLLEFLLLFDDGVIFLGEYSVEA